MSGRSSPGSGGETGGEPKLRLSVRKDLFPQESLAELAADAGATDLREDLDNISCVKLETDFEQSIDEIASTKHEISNGVTSQRSKHRKHKQHLSRGSEASIMLNGSLPAKTKRKKSSRKEPRPHRTLAQHAAKVKGGKNLYLVSSSECHKNAGNSDDEDEKVEYLPPEEESSEDEVLNNVISVKLPQISAPRQSGKPYSHQLSQLSSKKNKCKDSSKEKRSHTVTPCSGKPRAMLDICSSRSRKRSKKPDNRRTYHSQIMDTNTIKIKIRRTNIHEQPAAVALPAPISIADVGQRKSKKKRAASPVASESSGEEYVPSRVDTPAAISVAAPKPRHAPTKTRKTTPKTHTNAKQQTSSKQPTTKRKEKSNKKTEKSKMQAETYKGPQSPWAESLPEEVLSKIFEHVVSAQGTLPTLIRLGKVCRRWHAVSARPALWRCVDLAQNTVDKCKTDYKLVWLLENRLTKCQVLNVGHWKVSNETWVLACLADYCPELQELGLAGWSRVTADQLHDVFASLPRLQRVDLSHMSDTGGSGSCLSAASVARVAESFGARLTHLTLANNCFTALPQILASIAASCPNLEVLDISCTRATSHPAAVPLEALQRGCPRMRVFRAANAQLVLAAATTAQQMEAGGWSLLEELSIAGSAAAERGVLGEYRLGDEALARLLRAATRLRLLDLRGLQRLSDSGLVRVPAWDLQHLFLGGSNVLRASNACLELICEKWSHSLVELDLSWATAARPLDDALAALADADHTKLRVLNLCGSSVSFEAVKKVLLKCHQLESLNISACRSLPRGMKRLYVGKELQDLKDSVDPEKVKAKEENEKATKKGAKTSEATPEKALTSSKSPAKSESPSDGKASPVFQEPRTPTDSESKRASKGSPDGGKAGEGGASPVTSSTARAPARPAERSPDPAPPARWGYNQLAQRSPYSAQPSPAQPSPYGTQPSSTQPSPYGTQPSPAQPSPYGTQPSPAQPSPYGTQPSPAQPSPYTSQPSPAQPSPYSTQPSPAQPSPYATQPSPAQPSPYTGQPSPAQPSPYTSQHSPAQPSPYSTQPSPAQPSPYSAQPSPYSSQPSPYSAQPSPDTSGLKGELHAWSAGGYSPAGKARGLGGISPLLRECQLPAPDWGWAPPPPRDPDPWALGQFRVEPPLPPHTFVEQSVSLDALGHHPRPSFLDDFDSRPD